MRGWRWVFLCGVAPVLFLAGCAALVNHHAQGLSLLEERRLSEAWEAFEKGYEQDPRSPYSLNNMGLVVEMRDNDLIGAAKLYRQAIQACQAYTGDPSVNRLQQMAKENLQRVVNKLQTEPMLYISAPDPHPRS